MNNQGIDWRSKLHDYLIHLGVLINMIVAGIIAVYYFLN